MPESKDSINAFIQSIMSSTNVFDTDRKSKFEKPGRTIVPMNEGKLVQASDNNTEIFTFGLLGCNAVAIEGICNNKRFGVITHYSPTNIESNLLKITQLREQISGGNFDKVNAELFVRGDWEKVNDKWEMKPKSSFEVERLTQSVKKSFGENTSIKVSPYDTELEYGKEEQGHVTVNLTPKASKRILGIF